MGFDPVLAQTRFGYGCSPVVAAPSDVADMMQRLNGPDEAGRRFSIPSAEKIRDQVKELAQHRSAFKRAKKGSDEKAQLQKVFQNHNKEAHRDVLTWTLAELQRRVWTKDALRERLVAFWADHFSAPGKIVFWRVRAPAHVNSYIRPLVTGKFEDLLISAVTAPQMLHYLDQSSSVGPNSTFAKKRAVGVRGLNENLAREILELHTLGVGGAYSQTDVRQLAELLTGLTTSVRNDTKYHSTRVEPGSETVLGKEYQTRRSRISDIHEVLRDLARHPDTARHIARKLAVHFTSDQPDETLVKALEATFLETNGDLMQVTETLLRHPTAWTLFAAGQGNFKQPELFICSALRALAVPAERLAQTSKQEVARLFATPLRNMGQPWRTPLGPDGFAEGDAHWVSAQGMGARVQWALGAPTALLGDLPDPRDFVETTLGPDAPGAVRFAAKAAENRREGIALVLMSPAFQRI